MNIETLMLLLVSNDVKLIPRGGRQLDVDGPARAITPALVEALRQHKVTLLRRMAAIERGEPEPVSRHLERLITDENIAAVV